MRLMTSAIARLQTTTLLFFGLSVCIAITGNAAMAEKFDVVKFDNNVQKGPFTAVGKFTLEPNLPAGKYTYIIELNELPLAQDPKSVAELIATKQQNNRAVANRLRSNFAVQQQLERIEGQQQTFLDQASSKISGVKALSRFKYGINGLTLTLNQTQAQILSELPQVKRIQREQTRRLYTDRGPTLIGAPKVWDGSAFANVEQTQGEGIVIGIIDSGINTDHPSFAEVSGDGYLHTNPLGNGIYLGDCAGNFPELCNNKLIGVYSYPGITNSYSDTTVFPPNLARNGEDYGGHGSHVASIAAGNILRNVDEVFPTEGEERSSGTPTGFTFTQISGVAPRANIISYQVCFGGTSEREDTYADCKDGPILQAIDDAIRDNVDVINYSISGGGDPWTDLTEQAFLSARNAGIFVATSAGNSGPEAETSEKHSPWYTSVAASEHGRENVFLKELNTFTGGASSLSPIVGQSNSGAITAPIVYAANFANANDPGGDPAQCLQPFPAGTFNGQIVVCDRGDIARVQKAINVRDGGAGGYVLANLDGGTSFLANDQYVIPGIHINAENGNRLKSWLQSGQNHRATINVGLPTQFIDENRVDVVSDFSSRGPNTSFSLLIPTMTAPGSNIYAAYADEQLGHDGHEPAASDFTTLNGTSMSSPHVAGAAALVKSARPLWDADEIRSALALTASSAMKKEDAETDATFFDMGSGRIQVDKAIASPLIMSETANNYASANPNAGGDPRTLNIPSITDIECAGICTWTRTFTATVDATFSFDAITISPGLNIMASPSTFTLLEGQSQTVSFEINSAQASKVDYSFGIARFTTPGMPDVNIPVSVLSSIGDIPVEIEIEGRRSSDTKLIKNIEAINLNDFNVTAYKPVKATIVNGDIAEDSSGSDYLDDINDGVIVTTINIGDDARRLIAEIKSSSASDLDLFVLFDEDNNGIPSSSEEIARSRSGDSTEEIAINYPTAGTYFIVVQNFNGSQSALDTFEMRYAIVNNELAGDSLEVLAPNSLNINIPFDMRVTYSLPDSQAGDEYYAAIAMGTTPGAENLGLINVDINRVDNDVFVDGIATRLVAGESVPLNITVKNNPTNEARDYRVVLPLPVGTEFTTFSDANSGQLVNNEIVWLVSKPAGDVSDTILNFSLQMLNGIQAGPVPVVAKSELSSPIQSPLEIGISFTKIQIEGPPIIDLNGNNSANLVVTETQTLVIPLVIFEPNDDSVTVTFTQTSGPLVSVLEANDSFTLTAPLVEADSQLTYDLSVTDSNGNSATGSISVSVLNNATPLINAVTAPTSANGGQNITISVDASDPENDNISIQINGNLIAGNSTTLRTPSVGSSVNYQISVSDGITEANQTITVSLTQAVPSTQSSGGSMSWWILLIFPIALCRRQAGRVLLH
jgi:subtilisin family serine protease